MPGPIADQRLALIQRFFTGTGPTYDHIVGFCTLGMDRLWKACIVAHVAKRPAPTRVLDLACGTGILTFVLARRYPNCHVVGVDVMEEYLEIAKQKAKALRVRNVEFILGRAEEVRLDGTFDCIVSSYLAKYADPRPLIRNLVPLLRPGGLLLFHDFTYPPSPRLVHWWQRYFKLLQGPWARRYPQWQTIFNDLPRLIRQTRWLPEFNAAVREAGFTEVAVEPLIFGAAAILTATAPTIQKQ